MPRSPGDGPQKHPRQVRTARKHNTTADAGAEALYRRLSWPWRNRWRREMFCTLTTCVHATPRWTRMGKLPKCRTLNRQPGMSPFARPERPKPDTRTSSCRPTTRRRVQAVSWEAATVACAHVFVDVVQAAVVRNEGDDPLAGLEKLHAHGLANRRVGLLRLDAAAGIRRY